MARATAVAAAVHDGESGGLALLLLAALGLRRLRVGTEACPLPEDYG